MIETKQVHLSGWQNGDKYMRKLYDECHNYIQDMTAFGWQPTQESTERHGRTTSHYQIMARETSMEHYNELRKLESEYESAKSQIKSYNSMEFTTVLLFLVLFTLPIKQIKRILSMKITKIAEVECKKLSLTLERLSSGGGM